MSHSHTIIIHTPLSLNVPSEYNQKKKNTNVPVSQSQSLCIFRSFLLIMKICEKFFGSFRFIVYLCIVEPL